jgi:hypothetical protein
MRFQGTSVAHLDQFRLSRYITLPPLLAFLCIDLHIDGALGTSGKRSGTCHLTLTLELLPGAEANGTGLAIALGIDSKDLSSEGLERKIR